MLLRKCSLGCGNSSADLVLIIVDNSTGLSMIPASLIVVLTITMAVGTKIMVQRNVIVRKLDSLEALGAVTDICSDKTGTLTQGRMVVKKAWVIAEGMFLLIYQSCGSYLTCFKEPIQSANLATQWTPPLRKSHSQRPHRMTLPISQKLRRKEKRNLLSSLLPNSSVTGFSGST